VVVVLDKRVLTKSYGPMFLNSLPDCTQVHGSLVKLPDAAKRWLAMGGNAQERKGGEP